MDEVTTDTEEKKEPRKVGFSVHGNKGINVTFENGWGVSVQWGPGNYCERKMESYDAPMQAEFWQSADAEIAIFVPRDHPEKVKYGFLPLAGDVVNGYTTPDVVASLFFMVAKFSTYEELEAATAAVCRVLNGKPMSAIEEVIDMFDATKPQPKE